MSLTLIPGPMKGGKSTTLMSVLATHGHVHKGLYINHSSDIRNPGENFSTHNTLLDPTLSKKINADFISTASLTSLDDALLRSYSTVCIDEGQFFTDLVKGVCHMVDDLKLDVFVASLNGDYKRAPIGDVHLLLCRADSIQYVQAVCERCARMKIRKDAIFTHRICDTSGEQIEVGAQNYMAVCRSCYETMNK